MKVFVEGVGIAGPGLNGWQASRPVLAGAAPYIEAAVVIPPCDLLPSAERRRTGLPVKVALAVGLEATINAQRDAAELPAIFASSAGDGENMHCIFEMLANNGREVSPTRFHNSVHNAPSGYWSIATRSMQPSTSLACYDESFAAGLIEAATQTRADGNAVVLIAYDATYPEPLHRTRPIRATFGAALVLNRDRTDRSLAELEITIGRNGNATTAIANAGLEALRSGAPAARSLPLLAALASLDPEQTAVADGIYLDYVSGNQLVIAVRRC